MSKVIKNVSKVLDDLRKEYKNGKFSMNPRVDRGSLLKSTLIRSDLTRNELADIAALAIAACESSFNIKDNTVLEIILFAAKEANVSWASQQNAEILELAKKQADKINSNVLRVTINEQKRLLKLQTQAANQSALALEAIDKAETIGRGQNAKKANEAMMKKGTSDHAKKTKAMKLAKEKYIKWQSGVLDIPFSGKKALKDDFVYFVLNDSILDSSDHLKNNMTKWKKELSQKNK